MNPNYQKMMKQVQKMQADMAKAQEDLANETVEASAGGGMVTVQVTGAIEIKSIKIDPTAVDPDDMEILEDMIMAAANEALRSAPTSGWAASRQASTSLVCPSEWRGEPCPAQTPCDQQPVDSLAGACSVPPFRDSSTSSANCRA